MAATTIRRPLALLVALAGVAVAAPAFAQEYEIVWQDEFDGTSLDTTKWSYQTGTGTAYGLPPGWGNEETQYYTTSSQNVFLEDGMLHIRANNNSIGGMPHSSGRIRTAGKFEFTYGRAEARIKLPKGQGMWAAFWMLPTNSPYGGWASSGEIDIMEAINQMDHISGTIHFGGPWPRNTYLSSSVYNGIDWSQDFHVFGVEWEEGVIRWTVDGNVYRTRTSDSWYSENAGGSEHAPFDTDFHLLLNLAVGGILPGSVNSSTVFPQTMLVDWVRVSQQQQSAYLDQPHAIPGRIQAEDFDYGASGQAYNDTDAGNNGGAYRTSGVDIEGTSGGGYNVGWVRQGEWIEYTVDVATAGTYLLEARVASPDPDGEFAFSIEDGPTLATIDTPQTGGFQAWTIASTEIELEAGEQIIRMTSTANAEHNIDWFELSSIEPTVCNEADLAVPFGVLNFADVQSFLGAFGAEQANADLAAPAGVFNFADVQSFLGLFGEGCE